MYALIFDPNAFASLEKLDKGIAKRIWDKIQSTKENPLHYFERLTARNDYKLRIGDYRVIADINNNTKTIEVTIIGHRKNIYKNI